MDRAQHLLETVFGYPSFRHRQADIIQALLNGGDALALMPTGGGKSLCYQIPALVRGGVGVVISPLIALMQNQVDALRQLGIRAAFLNSSLDAADLRETEQALIEGALDLIYVAPERLLTGRMLALLDRVRLALFAIDEAHCVSQWGHDFRRDYQQLSILHQRYPKVPRIALTATAEPRTRAEIIEQLDLHQAAVFVNSFDRPNIHYAISEGPNARQQLWRFLETEHPTDAGIVYCLSRKKVENTAEWLKQRGRRALPYHAGLSDETRRHHQAGFLREEGVIIVATIAFGMGIDKPDVRFVAHLNMPKSIEAYYQETGRAGRDGAPANAWMAYGLQDVVTQRQMVQAGDAGEQFKRVAHHKLEAMLGLCELTTCRRQSLLAYFGETLAEPCGRCDNCLDPPETWDATTAAQKALSCVYRTGQRFGVNYVIEVLIGRDNERIRGNRHHRLSTYGLGSDLSDNEWRGVFRQLIALGYLAVDLEGHGSLRLTKKCRALLRGGEQLELRRLRRASTPAEIRGTRKKTALRSLDEPLFETLRALRMELADQQGVPPYVIFHDATLVEMARHRPETPAALRQIPGVGDQKLERYGQAFLEKILAQPLSPVLNNSLSDTINETLHLYAQGKDVETIARMRELKISTIYGHLAAAIAAGLIRARDVLPLDEAQYTEIVTALELLGADREGQLKPVHEALNETYDYGILKCVLAEMR